MVSVLSLHSNLVIFKFSRLCHIESRCDLYIPIWLYSNRLLATLFIASSSFTFQSGYIQILFPIYWHYLLYFLYIPIWLYSNNATIDNKTNVTPFTFQSGYIQIIAGYGVVNYMQNFTFQSGYIQIPF